MRIVQINATYGIGSTGKQTKILHENLRRLGHESFVIAGIAEDSANNDDVFVPCGRVSKKINGLKARITGNQNNLACHTTKKILNYLDKVKPDVIQLENIHANFVSLKLLLEYIATNDIALVVVLHDCWFFTGKCTNYVDKKCFGWKDCCGNCPKLKQDIPSWLFDKTEDMLREKKALFEKIKKLTVVGVSEKITEDAKMSYVFGGRNCTCIPNVVDDTIFYADERKKSNEITVIAGSAQEWSEYKGINEFVKLGQMCRDACGDKVKIRLAGDTGKIDKSTLVKLQDSGVEMLGKLSQKELAEFYRNSDLFVSLSKGESYGLSISEALQCGLPVIAYEGYAEKELLSKYNCCKIVKNEKNIEEFFKILQSSINVENKEDTKSSVKESSQPLSIGDYVGKFLRIYEQN